MSKKEIMKDAKYSKYDATTGTTWVWYGGHSVFGYDLSRSDTPERDVINVGNFANNDATLPEVERGINNRIEYDREEFYGSMPPEQRIRPHEEPHHHDERCGHGRHWVKSHRRNGVEIRGHCAKNP